MRQIRRGSIRLSYDRCERGHQASPCGGHGHRQGRRQARTVCALPRPRRPGKMAPKASVSNEARRWADMCLASPSVISARALADDGAVIAATWSQRDVVTSKKRNFAITYGRVGDRAYAPTLPVQSSQSDEFLSPSGRRLVRFVDKNGDDGPTEVEVWSLGTGEGDGTCLEAVWTVAAKVHGPVFADEWFGGVAWSPSENLFVYVADRPHVSSFDDGKEGHSKPGRNTEADTWVDACRSKFDQASRDVLGEAYVNQRSPALFLGDVQRAACRALCLSIDDEPDVDDESQHLFGDPQWSSDGKWIAVTRRPSALTHPSLEADNISDKPYDLGTRYCYNRYSSVELLNAPTSLEDAETALLSMTPVTDHHDMADFCCSSPRFSPDSKVLVYVSAPRKTDGRAQSSILPHNTTKVLRGACILGGADGPSASHPVTIVDVVGKAARDEFPGLYLHGLPSRPWLGASPSVPSRSILLSSVWGSELRVLQIPVHVDGAGDGACVRALVAGDVLDVTPAMPGAPCVRSVSVLDVCARGAVFSCSSPVHPDQIAFAAVSTGGAGIPAVAQPVSFPSRRARELEAMARPFCSVDLVLSQTAAADVDAAVAAREFAPGEDDASQRYQVTLLVPCSASRTSRVPLVVYPHGGPHSCSVNTFSQGAAAMLTAGLAVLHVNFRGSLGLGQESLESLPGRAGTQDVSEVLQATQWALQVGSPDFLDERRVGYVGGSHGGFLGAHCSVVPGNLFKAVALRNPVCNISSMVNVTDIPDWCFCEAGLAAVSEETGLALGADPAALSKMWSVSPVARVRKGGPRPGRTILFVGASDRRVPPEQSVEWQRLITESHGAGIVTLRWYPKSGHAIDEVPNGDDVWVHTLELLGTL